MGKVGATGLRILAMANLVRRSFRLVCDMVAPLAAFAFRPCKAVYDSMRSEFEGVTIGRTVWYHDF
jgi:hypothetical protein